jgi:hypothetical protein
MECYGVLWGVHNYRLTTLLVCADTLLSSAGWDGGGAEHPLDGGGDVLPSPRAQAKFGASLMAFAHKARPWPTRARLALFQLAPSRPRPVPPPPLFAISVRCAPLRDARNPAAQRAHDDR